MEIERTGEDTITLTVSLEELGWLRMGLSTALEELGDDTHTIMGTTRDEIGRLLDESRDIYREVRPDLPWDEFDKMLERDTSPKKSQKLAPTDHHRDHQTRRANEHIPPSHA